MIARGQRRFCRPWTIKEEILQQISSSRECSGHFVVPIPEVRVCPAPAGS